MSKKNTYSPLSLNKRQSSNWIFFFIYILKELQKSYQWKSDSQWETLNTLHTTRSVLVPGTLFTQHGLCYALYLCKSFNHDTEIEFTCICRKWVCTAQHVQDILLLVETCLLKTVFIKKLKKLSQYFACQIRVTAGDSGLCYCPCMMSLSAS